MIVCEYKRPLKSVIEAQMFSCPRKKRDWEILFLARCFISLDKLKPLCETDLSFLCDATRDLLSFYCKRTLFFSRVTAGILEILLKPELSL